MIKKSMWYIIPTLIIMVIIFSQLMVPIGFKEVSIAVVSSLVSGITLGILLKLLFKFFLKGNLSK